MSRPDFEETRQQAGEACSEFLADPDNAGCGPRCKGLGPIAWMLIFCAAAPLVWLGIAHFAARFW